MEGKSELSHVFYYGFNPFPIPLSLYGCDGKCLRVCECSCVEFAKDDKEKDIIVYSQLCTCGHREHDGFCPGKVCCQPAECRRCLKDVPNYQIRYFEGLCKTCRVNGDIFTCPICLDSGYEEELGDFLVFKGACRICFISRKSAGVLFSDGYYRSYLANDDKYFEELEEYENSLDEEMLG